MQNYSSRFKLPNGKWAYIQLDEPAEAARRHIDKIRRLWRPPGHFFHLRKGGHVAALRRHQANRWYGKVDLSGFFNNVTRHRVTRSLKRIGYSYDDALNFAVASTVCVHQEARRFALPYGFVQSPLLASVALDKSDLGNCCRWLRFDDVEVTVYVDDIIVSASTENDVAAALSLIRSAAQNSQFPINEEKSTGPSTELQAFNIDLETHVMEIAALRYEQMCRDVLINGAGHVSQGIVSYVQSVNAEQAERMLRDFPRSFPDA
jgi:Reverse transcriptase (RNA-dependent DNA polymerase)